MLAFKQRIDQLVQDIAKEYPAEKQTPRIHVLLGGLQTASDNAGWHIQDMAKRAAALTKAAEDLKAQAEAATAEAATLATPAPATGGTPAK